MVSESGMKRKPKGCYKRLGVEVAFRGGQVEIMHQYIAKLVSHLNATFDNFTIDTNERRSIFRVPVEPPVGPGTGVELPEKLALSVHMVSVENKSFASPPVEIGKEVKLRIKDVSVGGFGVILPFLDEKNFTIGRVVKLRLQVGPHSFLVDGWIRFIQVLRASRGQVLFLKRHYFNPKLPEDENSPVKYWLATEKKDVNILNYSAETSDEGIGSMNKEVSIEEPSIVKGAFSLKKPAPVNPAPVDPVCTNRELSDDEFSIVDGILTLRDGA